MIFSLSVVNRGISELFDSSDGPGVLRGARLLGTESRTQRRLTAAGGVGGAASQLVGEETGTHLTANVL